jgi:hypothetical protein
MGVAVATVLGPFATLRLTDAAATIATTDKIENIFRMAPELLSKLLLSQTLPDAVAANTPTPITSHWLFSSTFEIMTA